MSGRTDGRKEGSGEAAKVPAKGHIQYIKSIFPLRELAL